MNAERPEVIEAQLHSRLHELDTDSLELHLSGKLTRLDYEQFIPEIERRIQEQGKIRLLIILEDFHGWHLAALWPEIRFDVRHFNHLERIAIVGENRWQEWMATMCMPFTTGEIRFFHQDQAEAAREWIRQR